MYLKHNNNDIEMAFYLVFVMYLALLANAIASSTPLIPNQDNGGGGCEMVACGHGNCKASSDSFLGFNCECHPGWTKVQIGRLVFPSCVIPNCTFDFQCFNRSRRFPFLLPPLNFSNPCSLRWCGYDGKCVANGSSYSCQCLHGSANLLNSTALPCFKQCLLGADCNNVNSNGLIGSPVSSPLSSPLPPHAIANSSRRNGSAVILRILHTVILTLLVGSGFASLN